MADREEDPTAFSLVVNGQIELAEVSKENRGEEPQTYLTSFLC